MYDPAGKPDVGGPGFCSLRFDGAPSAKGSFLHSPVKPAPSETKVFVKLRRVVFIGTIPPEVWIYSTGISNCYCKADTVQQHALCVAETSSDAAGALSAEAVRSILLVSREFQIEILA